MSADRPSTKDLTKEARKDAAYREVSAMLFVRLQQHVTALADRLEEVEEEVFTVIRWAEEHAANSGCDVSHAEGMLHVTSRLRVALPSPEPSDPEPDGMRGFTAEEVKAAREMKEQFFFGEDPEPKDDPWDAIERLHGAPAMGWLEGSVIGALLDLRERVEKVATHVRILDRDTAKHRQDNLKRLTTLEGHADRGSEVVEKLEARVEGLREDIGGLDHDVAGAIRDLNVRVKALESHRVERLEGER